MICMMLLWNFKEYSSKAYSCVLSFCGCGLRGGCSGLFLRGFVFNKEHV